MHFENEGLSDWAGQMREESKPHREPTNLSDEIERLSSMINDLEQSVWDRARNKLAFVLGPDQRVERAVVASDLKSVSDDAPAIEQVIGMQKRLDHFVREMTAILDRVQL